ncbi:MAG: leucine-rich repeat domain-containing protein [Bacteroidaceae bacterium]|nr:leucine-rich repeat domain-containing protein [Bacteroidaceae bacterium]
MIAIVMLSALDAHSFVGKQTIDGITYYIVTKGKTAKVTDTRTRGIVDLVIPATIECEGVTCDVVEIEAGALSFDDDGYDYNKYLRSVTIGSNVKTIGIGAFSNCLNLQKITFLNTDDLCIRRYAFEGCDAITSVHCTNVSNWMKITFESDTSNPMYAAKSHLFFNNQHVKNLIIPDGVSKINPYAFLGCIDLESVTFPNTLTEIGKMAFPECPKLTSITIPPSVRSIGSNNFCKCSQLTSITLHCDIDRCFNNCPNLQSIIFGPLSSKVDITSSFQSCPELTDVYFYVSRVKDPYWGYWDTNKDLLVHLGDNYAFDGSEIKYTTLHVPDYCISAYCDTWPGPIVALTEEETAVETPYPNKECTTSMDVYDLGGQYHKTPQKGVNIIRKSDGRTKKVYMK